MTDFATRRERQFGDRVVRCYAQRAPDLQALFLRSAERRPDAEAVVCGPRRLTWRQAREQVMRLAGGLRRCGVEPGDRVALLLGNDVEFFLVTFAAAMLGAITVPIGIREQTAGLAYILRHSGAKLLVHEASLAERLPAGAETPDLQLRFAVGGEVAGTRSFASLAAQDALPDPVPAHEEDVAIIMYTSGTTGFPKGAMLTHGNVVHSVMHYEDVFGLTENERGCVTVPLSHVTGLVALMMLMASLGGTLVVMPAFKARDFLQLAQDERITFTVMVPAMYNLCLLEPDVARYDLAPWRIGAFGGAPMAPATIDRLAEVLPGLQLANCYGATETASPATIMPPAHTRANLDSVGRTVPCGEISVMDEDGREVAPGEAGELWLKGPMVVKGYWNNPDATKENFVGGFWRSGDIGSMDPNGFVRVMDRRKDMLNRGGYKIYSVEVENVLSQHEDVLEAAVVAKPCPVLGERVHVFVAAREGRRPEAESLRAFCAARLADYKVPEAVTITREPLPRNANGKLLKRELRERLLKELGLQ